MGTLLKIDFSKAEGASDPVAEGDYLARAVRVTYSRSKSSNQPMLNFEYVIHPDHETAAGRHLWNNASLAPKALWRTKQVFEAHGIDVEGDFDLDVDEDTGSVKNDEFFQSDVVLTVINEEYQGVMRSKVSAVRAAEEEDYPL